MRRVSAFSLRPVSLRRLLDKRRSAFSREVLQRVQRDLWFLGLGSRRDPTIGSSARLAVWSRRPSYTCPICSISSETERQPSCLRQNRRLEL